MFAVLSITEYPATAAGGQFTSRAQCLPMRPTCKSTQAMYGMCATASAAASILLHRTDVIASVSLFALLITLGNFLLASLISPVGLLGLVGLLSGLTRLVISLVGLIKGLSPGMHTGD